MNAVATLANAAALSSDSWLVPTNALRTSGADTVVMVVREQQTIPIAVTTGTVQGEWTIVSSVDLQAGDEVVGIIAWQTDEQSSAMGGPPAGADAGMLGGPPQ
jgi:hypothetical protein